MSNPPDSDGARFFAYLPAPLSNQEVDLGYADLMGGDLKTIVA
jgi:hypothetical protein